MMRCPDCKTLISWVPRPDGRRVPISVEQDPDGGVYLDAEGVARLVTETLASDVPRYATHLHETP